MTRFAQPEPIRTLRLERTKSGGEDALCKWLERCFKVSSLRSLSKDTVQKVMTALKAIKARAA